MAQTNAQLPTTVIPNTTVGTDWLNPENILLVDGQYAVSSGNAQILTVGNFQLNLQQGDTVTNIVVQVKGYRGSFNTTLQIYAVDNTSGVDLSYPLLPFFQGFDGTDTLYTLPATLFATTWTVDQINNIKIMVIANGELYLDAITVNVIYTPISPLPPAPTPGSGETVCCEFVQAQKFSLAQSMTSTALYALLTSFNYSDGTPIQYADFYGDALLVIDEGVPGKEENVRITAVDQNYNGSGYCRLSFTTLANRGLAFHYPYTTDTALRQDHTSTAQVVISNSAPFYDRFLKKCQIDALVSAPIIVEDESVALADPAHTLDFQGAGVSVVNDGSDSHKKIITIPGNGVNPPVVSSTSSSTSGGTQVPTITWSHVSSGINRLLVVQVETEAAATVTGVTFNGVALTQGVTTTNGTIRNEQWYLVAPPVGTYSIIVSVSPNAVLTCGAETYNTVNQSTPIGVTQTATGNSNTPSLVLTTGSDNSIIVDSLATGLLPIVYTVGAGQTTNWKLTSNPNVRQGASSTEPAGSAPDNVTMSWAMTQSTPWAQTAMEILGIEPPPLPPSSGVASVTGFYVNNTDPANPIITVPKNNMVATTNPAAGNDNTQGYSIGSIWFNKTNMTAWIAQTVGTGTATWTQVLQGNGKNNPTATTVPGVGNDNTQGYSIGSMWFNTSTGLLYVAQTVGTGTATWTPVSVSSGSVLSNVVNADETSSGWITVQLNPTDALTWTKTGAANPSPNGILINSTNNYRSNSLLGYNNSSPGWNTLNYNMGVSNPGKLVKLRWQMAAFASNAAHYAMIGFSDTATAPFRTSTTDNTIRVVVNNTTAFAVTSDGAANTNTDMVVSQGYANPHVYEIVWNPGTDVKFYVDGILKTTITTSIPTANVNPILWMVVAGGESNQAYITGMVLSQQI